jgi:hypothetical protein
LGVSGRNGPPRSVNWRSLALLACLLLSLGPARAQTNTNLITRAALSTRGRAISKFISPTRVPPEFVICVGFSPTGTKGVFVPHESGGSGSSVLALPGSKGRPFDKGDRLIRATVQEAKDLAYKRLSYTTFRAFLTAFTAFF